MTNMPAAGYAARCAIEHPTLGVGLHFNLTLGQSMSGRASSIADAEGSLGTRRDLAIRSITGRIRAGDVHAELEAQYGAMRALGLSPSHVDSHQHVHAIPGVFAVVSAFAAEKRLPMRMPWKWKGHSDGKRLPRQLKEVVLSGTLRLLDRRRPKSIAVNDGFCSLFDLASAPDRQGIEAYRTVLAPYQSGFTELMVHPAYVDEELAGKTAITGMSHSEMSLLMDPGFPEMVKELGFRLTTFHELASRAN